MSEKLCTLRTKGGGGGAKQEETVLWTNPNPTSSSGFAAQTVTLSDSISNYDYIYVTWGYNSSYTGTSNKNYYSVSDFKNLTLGGGTRHFIGQGGAQDTSNNTYTREIYYVSDTSIGFTVGYGVNRVQSVANVIIPLSIIGIKNMGGIRTDEKYDTLPFQSVAGNAIPTFSTQGMAKAIWVVRYVSSMAKAVTYSNVNPYTGEIDDSNTYYYDSSTPGVVGTTSSIKFIVTNGQITTSAPFSNAAHLLQLNYTY